MIATSIRRTSSLPGYPVQQAAYLRDPSGFLVTGKRLAAGNHQVQACGLHGMTPKGFAREALHAVAVHCTPGDALGQGESEPRLPGPAGQHVQD